MEKIHHLWESEITIPVKEGYKKVGVAKPQLVIKERRMLKLQTKTNYATFTTYLPLDLMYQLLNKAQEYGTIKYKKKWNIKRKRIVSKKK